MNLNEYQKQAMKTYSKSSPEYPFICLSEEAGEVLGKINKFMRKQKTSSSESVLRARHAMTCDASIKLKEDLIKELGDLQWYIAACASELNIPLDLIATTNIKKLQDRDDRGVICGSGDNR